MDPAAMAALASRCKARAEAEAKAASYAALPRTEKLSCIIAALKAVPGHGPISPADLSATLHFEIDTDMELMRSLQSNPLVVLDGEGNMSFKPEVDVRSLDELMRKLDVEPFGIPVGKITDAYPTAAADVEAAKLDGSVIYIKSQDSNKFSDVIFSRHGDPLLIPLPGTAHVSKGQWFINTSVDLTSHLFRGDALVIDGEVYRVSTAVVMPSGTTEYAASKAIATGGVMSVAAVDTHLLGAPTHRYKYEFKGTRLPLDRPYAGESREDAPLQRHGCSAVLRQMWAATVAPKADPLLRFDRFPDRHDTLRREMEKKGIKTKMGDRTIRHENTFTALTSKGGKRKRTFNRDTRANLHLVGTAAGDELDRARAAIALEKGGK